MYFVLVNTIIRIISNNTTIVYICGAIREFYFHKEKNDRIQYTYIQKQNNTYNFIKININTCF